MTTRQWLVLGVAGLIVSAASRVTAASGPVQADAEAYAGSAVGEWACGPSARAKYAGGGGHVRVYTDDAAPKPAVPPDPVQPEPRGEYDEEQDRRLTEERRHEMENAPDIEPHGPSFGVGGGLEHRGFERIACNATPCTENDVVPRSLVLYAGRANFGWDWDYFGFRAGALGYQRWSENTDSSPTSYVLPDAELRFGRRVGFHGGLGFGAYNVVTTFRPGGYGFVGYADGRWAAELRTGVHAVFDGQLGGRADISARYAITRSVSPGLGLGLTTAKEVSPEARVFVLFTP